MKEFWQNIKSWRGDFAIQGGFNKKLQEIGEYFVYLKANSHFKCTACYNGATLDADATCTQCYGTGFKTTAYYTQGILMDGLSPMEGGLLSEQGFYNKNITSILLNRRINPNLFDRILRVNWNVHPRDIPTSAYTVPTLLTHSFRITYINPVYVEEIQFYQAQLNELNTSFNFYTNSLPRFTNLNIL